MGEIRHILTSPPFRRQAVFIQFPWGSIFCKWSSRLKGFKWEALTIWSNSSYEAVCFAALNFASFRTQYKLSEAMSAFKLSSSLEISIASRRRKKLNLDIQASFSMERHITQYQLSKQVLDIKPLYLEMKMMSRYVKNSSKFAYILLAKQCRYPTNSRFVIIFLKNLLGHSVPSHKSIHRIPISKKQSCL